MPIVILVQMKTSMTVVKSQTHKRRGQQLLRIESQEDSLTHRATSSLDQKAMSECLHEIFQ